MRKILIGFLFFIVLINSADALVGINPPSGSLSMFSDMYFFAEVEISGVNDVYGFQFDLSYDPSIFEIEQISDVSEGTFLNRSGLDKTFCINPDVSTSGLIDNFACSRVGSGSGVSGSGVLANIKLKIKSLTTFPQTSDIVLSEVKISDMDSVALGEEQGTRTCNSNKEWGDCVVSPDGNGGDGGNGNGGGFLPPIVTDGEEEEDSFYSGDVNNDGCTDIRDLALVGANFGLTPEDTGFDPRADINGDGEVIMFDVVIVGIDFGSGCGG
jgi:hypothetical protein